MKKNTIHFYVIHELEFFSFERSKLGEDYN